MRTDHCVFLLNLSTQIQVFDVARVLTFSALYFCGSRCPRRQRGTCGDVVNFKICDSILRTAQSFKCVDRICLCACIRRCECTSVWVSSLYYAILNKKISGQVWSPSAKSRKISLEKSANTRLGYLSDLTKETSPGRFWLFLVAKMLVFVVAQAPRHNLLIKFS